MSDSLISIGVDSAAGSNTSAPETETTETISTGEQTAGSANSETSEATSAEKQDALSAPVQDELEEPAESTLENETEADLTLEQPTDSTPIKQMRTALRNAKAETTSLRTELEAAKTAALPEDVRALYDQAKDFQLKMSQIPATPEEAAQMASENFAAIENLNPQVASEMKQNAFWGYALEADGAPNLPNLQLVIDELTGEPGKVPVADVLLAIERMREGTLSNEDLNLHLSEGERAWREKQKAEETESLQLRNQWQEELRGREQEVREQAANTIVTEINSQFQSGFKSHLETLKLLSDAADAPDAAEFKQEILAQLSRKASELEAENADLQYLRRSIETLKKPTGIKTEEAKALLARFQNSLDFKERAARGMRDVQEKLREYANRQARYYNRFLRGAESVEIADRVKKARVEPRAQVRSTNGQFQPNAGGMSVVERGAQMIENIANANGNKQIG